jgi:hypothetical protein
MTIPKKESRNKIGEIPRRELGPARPRQWVPAAQLSELWDCPPGPTLEKDLEKLRGELTDPWAS